MDWSRIALLVLDLLGVLALVTVGAHARVTPIFRPVAELAENLIVLLCGWAVRGVEKGCKRLYAWSFRKRAEAKRPRRSRPESASTEECEAKTPPAVDAEPPFPSEET